MQLGALQKVWHDKSHALNEFYISLSEIDLSDYVDVIEKVVHIYIHIYIYIYIYIYILYIYLCIYTYIYAYR